MFAPVNKYSSSKILRGSSILQIGVFLLLGSSLLLSSCSKSDSHPQDIEGYNLVEFYSDSFDVLKDFWNKNEVTDSTRYEIVHDPLDDGNNTLKFYLYADDWNANGKRNEFKIDYNYTSDEVDKLKSTYSFNFLFTEEFFKPREETDWIMIHQWHDKPPKGVSWGDYNLGTHPPINVFIQVGPEGESSIHYSYGLWTKDFKDVQNIQYSEPLEPNKWYTFENKVKWSMDQNGYSIPKINGEYLSESSSEGKMIGANLFNDQGNYYKMGLYGNKRMQDTISVYFDDFEYNFHLKE